MRRLFAMLLRLAALVLVAVVLLVRPAMAEATHGATDVAQTLGRLQTLCSDGTRAVSTYHKTLSRWESTITSPPGQTCRGRVNSRTLQVEGRCR
jgi:hypothetical protein